MYISCADWRMETWPVLDQLRGLAHVLVHEPRRDPSILSPTFGQFWLRLRPLANSGSDSVECGSSSGYDQKCRRRWLRLRLRNSVFKKNLLQGGGDNCVNEQTNWFTIMIPTKNNTNSLSHNLSSYKILEKTLKTADMISILITSRH